MKLEIKLEDKVFRGTMADLRGALHPRAIAQGVSRAADRGSVFAQRKIRQEYNVTASQARGAFSVRMQGDRGLITATGRKGRNVILFLKGGRGRPGKGKRPQLQFEIRRGQRVSIPGSFVVEHNRGRFVAQRVGPGRMPIKSVRTVDIPGMFNARRVMEATIKQIRDVFLPDQALKGLNKVLNRALRNAK